MKPMKRILALCLTILLFLLSMQVSFAAGTPPYKGIDVSRWQGTVDWAKVKKSGVDFAILRCFAYRKDANFETNYSGATAQGIPVGAYVYMYATSEASAVKEAQDTLAALGKKPLTLPLFLDVEDADVKALGKTKVTDLMLIELSIFAAAGYPVGIYSSLSHTKTDMDVSRLTGYDWWIARWTCYTTDQNPKTFLFSDQDPAGTKKPDCDIWQFSNGGHGSTYGMGSTYVDLDYCYKDYIHGGAHTPNDHNYQIQAIAPSCTAPGHLEMICADCGDTQTVPYTSAALGHTAPDESGKCTRCGTQLSEATPPETPQEDQPGQSNVCPYCGAVHDGLFGWIRRLLHYLLYIFRV